jgi:PAS domain S-box-containing protein
LDLERRDGTYLQFIADATAAGIAHCSADRRFLFVNEAYAARFGLAPGELVGRPVVEILGEEAYETIRPYVERVLAGESLQYDTSVNYKVAGWYYLHCAYTPEIDEEGRVVGWVAVITDISDRYRLEQALRRVESGDLTDEQVERLGRALMQLEDTFDELIDHFGVVPDDLYLPLDLTGLDRLVDPPRRTP